MPTKTTVNLATGPEDRQLRRKDFFSSAVCAISVLFVVVLCLPPIASGITPYLNREVFSVHMLYSLYCIADYLKVGSAPLFICDVPLQAALYRLYVNSVT